MIVSYDNAALLDIIPGHGKLAVYLDDAGREFSARILCQLVIDEDGSEVETVSIDELFDGVVFAEEHRNFLEVR